MTGTGLLVPRNNGIRPVAAGRRSRAAGNSRAFKIVCFEILWFEFINNIRFFQIIISNNARRCGCAGSNKAGTVNVLKLDRRNKSTKTKVPVTKSTENAGVGLGVAPAQQFASSAEMYHFFAFFEWF